jgi:nucleoid DNA-binding protein
MSNTQTISIYAKQMKHSIAGTLNEGQCKEFIEILLDHINNDIKDGINVRLNNFGIFKLKTRPARKGRNPQTGEEIDIDEKQVITFKPTKASK